MQDATTGRLQSFFASLECELIDYRWKSFAEERMAIFTWIEGWYNPRRHYSGIGQKSPISFKKGLQDKTNATHVRHRRADNSRRTKTLVHPCP